MSSDKNIFAFPIGAFEAQKEAYCDLEHHYFERPSICLIKKDKNKFLWFGEGQYGQEANLFYNSDYDYGSEYYEWVYVKLTELGK